MSDADGSARKQELREGAYQYVLAHGLTDLSLRPLAAAIGSSPRVLVYLFGSKDGLVAELLGCARRDELAVLGKVGATSGGLQAASLAIWAWLADPRWRRVLRLWVEAYGQSLTHPAGPWGSFARATVRDLLDVLAGAQEDPAAPGAVERRTAALALLRGGMLDLLATDDDARVDAAVRRALAGQLEAAGA